MHVEPSMPKPEQQAADDANIGDVENRPPAQVYEIHHGTITNDVEQISGSSAESQSESDLRNAALKPQARAMQKNRGRESKEPDEDQHRMRVPAAVNVVEIDDTANLQKRNARCVTARREELHDALAPLIEEQDSSAGHEQACQIRRRSLHVIGMNRLPTYLNYWVQWTDEYLKAPSRNRCGRSPML